MDSEPPNMVSSKRSASPLEGAVIKSTKKLSSHDPDPTDDFTEAPLAAPVRIIVSVRSEPKAKRNDPKRLDQRDDPAEFFTRAADPGVQSILPTSGTIREDGDAELDEETKALSDMSGLPFPDDFPRLKWLERIDGIAFVKGNWIGYCDAKLIRRLQIHHKFSTAMAKPTRETSELAFELFDRYGRLSKEFQEHPVNKGTGVWGNELNGEDILLFEYIRIEPGHRRQMIGTKIVNAVLNKARRKSTKFFALAKPRYLVEEIDIEHTEQGIVATKNAEQFFRSMGFRRVGNSGWFAFTDDSSHPSKLLETSHDWNRSPLAQVPQSTAATFDKLRGPDMVDTQCVRLLQTDLRLQLEENLGILLDETGNTILHLFALRTWPRSIAYAIDEWPQLKSVRNREGHTPLEALQRLMETSRTVRTENGKTHAVSDDFRGFNSTQIASLGALEGVNVCDLDKVSKEVIARVFITPNYEFQRIPGDSEIRRVLRLKYGCTCGHCIGGFLSPRMQYALRQQAYWQIGVLRAQISNGPTWLKWHSSELERVPSAVRQLMESYKCLRVGFAHLSKHFSTCIAQKRIPNEANILSVIEGSGEWPPTTKLYLSNGGTVASAVTALLHKVKDQSPWAIRRSVRDTPWVPWTQPDPMPGMVECRNDLEFGFVTEMCGFERSED